MRDMRDEALGLARHWESNALAAGLLCGWGLARAWAKRNIGARSAPRFWRAPRAAARPWRPNRAKSQIRIPSDARMSSGAPSLRCGIDASWMGIARQPARGGSGLPPCRGHFIGRSAAAVPWRMKVLANANAV